MDEVKAGRPERAGTALRACPDSEIRARRGRICSACTGNGRCLRSPGESVEYQPEQGDCRRRGEIDSMGRKGAVLLAHILAIRSNKALEQAVLLICEQLGFRFFMC